MKEIRYRGVIYKRIGNNRNGCSGCDARNGDSLCKVIKNKTTCSSWSNYTWKMVVDKPKKICTILRIRKRTTVNKKRYGAIEEKSFGSCYGCVANNGSVLCSNLKRRGCNGIVWVRLKGRRSVGQWFMDLINRFR